MRQRATARPSVRIVNETGLPGDTRVIEPVSGNRIPNVRKVTWESAVGKLGIATIELYATLDVMADGTFVVTSQPSDDQAGGEMDPEATSAMFHERFPQPTTKGASNGK